MQYIHRFRYVSLCITMNSTKAVCACGIPCTGKDYYTPLFEDEKFQRETDMMPTVPSMDDDEAIRKNSAFGTLLDGGYRCAASNLARAMHPDALLAFVANNSATCALDVLRLFPAHAKLESLEDEEVCMALRSRSLPRLSKVFVIRRYSGSLSRILKDAADEFSTEELLEIVFLGGPVKPVFFYMMTSGKWAALRALLSYLRDEERLDSGVRSCVFELKYVLAGFPELDIPKDIADELQVIVNSVTSQKASS